MVKSKAKVRAYFWKGTNSRDRWFVKLQTHFKGEKRLEILHFKVLYLLTNIVNKVICCFVSRLIVSRSVEKVCHDHWEQIGNSFLLYLSLTVVYQ